MLLPLLLAGLLGASEGPAGAPSSPLVQGELAYVCRRLQEGRNPFFGRAVVAELRQQLAALPPFDVATRLRLQVRLAEEKFRLGDVPEAVRGIEEVLAFAEREGLNPDLRLDLLSRLAVFRMRLAENENCILRHTAASCIFPVAGEGIHTVPAPARLAGDQFLRVLSARPGDLTARWLLNLARMTSGDFPAGVPEGSRLPPRALESEAPFPRWRDIAPELGLAVWDLAGGAVMDDLDGDGLLDIVTSTMDPCGSLKAFRNNGQGGFENVTQAWGLDRQLGGLYLVQADFDNDGMLDLLVARGGWMGTDGRVRNSLLRNDLRRPERRFTDVTAAAGIAYPAYPMQAAAWADFDGDGNLDLFLGNEAPSAQANTVRRTAAGHGEAYPSQLFRNNGDGTFTDVARRAGVDNHRFAKGAAWGDYDNDGDPDLYVSNVGPNRLYRNNGDGTFTDVAPELRVTEPAGQSFPTWFFDFDNDGDLDLFVADYSARVEAVFASYFGDGRGPGHPVLYRNDGGRFINASEAVGLTRPALPMGSNYGDLDNDGWPDFYLGTGVPDFQALIPNLMYRNDRGRRFQDVTFAGGFGHLQKGHAVSFGDLDNDGDQDILEQMGGAFPYDAFANALYENPGSEAAWITLRLEGTRANRFGVGARIEVVVREGGERRSIHALAGSGGSFGANSLQQEIGLGKATAIESITLRWPGSGTVQTLRDVAPNRIWRVVEGEAAARPVDLPRLRLGGSPAPHHHPPGGKP
jgi:VCBS repeat protein/ASPIC/UnbV protein